MKNNDKNINLENVSGGLNQTVDTWEAQCSNPGKRVGNGCDKYKSKYGDIDTLDLPPSMCIKCKNRGT